MIFLNLPWNIRETKKFYPLSGQPLSTALWLMADSIVYKYSANQTVVFSSILVYFSTSRVVLILYKVVSLWFVLFLVQIFWNAGCQLVALNYQTLGKWGTHPLILCCVSPLQKITVDRVLYVHLLLILLFKASWFFPECVENELIGWLIVCGLMFVNCCTDCFPIYWLGWQTFWELTFQNTTWRFVTLHEWDFNLEFWSSEPYLQR